MRAHLKCYYSVIYSLSIKIIIAFQMFSPTDISVLEAHKWTTESLLKIKSHMLLFLKFDWLILKNYTVADRRPSSNNGRHRLSSAV